MKYLYIVLATVLLMALPVRVSAEASSSANSSGDSSAAAAASDGVQTSISTSGENASAETSIDDPNSVSTEIQDPASSSNKIAAQEATASIAPDTTKPAEIKTPSGNISDAQYQKFSSELQKFEPVSERTVKILKLLAAAMIGIILIIVLQVAILLKNRKLYIKNVDAGLNKF